MRRRIGDKAAVKPDGRSLDIVVVGLGQGGGNIATEFFRRGYPAVALNTAESDLHALDPGGEAIPRWAHLGLYGYRARTLERLARLPPTALERVESLEQLRALGHGIAIHCARTDRSSAAVDRPEDVPLAEAALEALVGASPR